ncbi:MAG TPA: hypothetical protein VHE30_29755 [Polyangiaceae bacterium]|nr:hypothetical protein [Polyangiaceae bacterium]
MKSLKKTIHAHQTELRNHRLFHALGELSTVEPLARLARGCAWLPMVFQDVLRLNLERVRGTDFERFAIHHRDEDAGHEIWFLSDLRALGVESLGIEELFAEEFRPIRDACYALTAEIFAVSTGAQRIGFILSLEATGHVFFENVARAVDRVCPDLPLRYFSQFHLGVEKAHDLFTEQTESDLDRIVLGEAEHAEAEELVARTMRIFDDVFSYFADRMADEPPRASFIHELRRVRPAPARIAYGS